MYIREFFVLLLSAIILTPFGYVMLTVGSAQGMQSTNYKIESDSVNFGGGFSSSTNYTLESTAGEIATGESGSASYNLRAGYQQMHGSTISISAPSNVIMTPTISGIAGGVSNGSTTVTVTTDGSAGYALSIKASENPALRSGANTIADYVPVGIPDFTFTTGASDSHFGYSPEGINIVTRFKDDGINCNIDTQDTSSACWDGLDTVDEIIAQSASANTPLGSTTTVKFRVEIGGSVVQAPGTYVATTTLTAVAL